MIPQAEQDELIFFNITDLSGDSDAMGYPNLAEIIADNGGEPEMDPDELARLRACPVGGEVYMGIGGGAVIFRRVAGRYGGVHGRVAPKTCRRCGATSQGGVYCPNGCGRV